MYNTILEQQANDAREDINAIVKELIIEINESEEAYEKLEGKIDELEEIIEGLKAERHDFKNKMSKKTAVEWFNDEILIHLNFDQRLYLKDISKKAKEMEKEQMKSAHGEEQSKLQGDCSFNAEL